MQPSRIVYQSSEKVRAMCEIMHRVDKLPAANMKALAEHARLNYSTLRSAARSGKFTADVEHRLAAFCGFDCYHSSWIDDAIDGVARSKLKVSAYPGRDTVEFFRTHLLAQWTNPSAIFGARSRNFSAFDPHMARHELTDCGQSTAAGSDIPFFLTSQFEPFYHHSGIRFGFRKVKIALDIRCENGARASHRLGHPTPARIRDALISGEGMIHQLQWSIEKQGESEAILHGEYATTEEPLVTISNYIDGTSITTRIEVNIFDRTTCTADSHHDLSPNKSAVIEQIFSRLLPDAQDRNGWITLSEQECVIARYEQ